MRLLNKLKKFVELNGYAKTAYLLGYRDTDAIKKWFHKGAIPEKKIEIVKELLL